MNHPHADASPDEVNKALQQSSSAFEEYRKQSLRQRAVLLRSIAKKLGDHQQDLLSISNAETYLGEARLRSELTRTIFQLNSYADACEQGTWMDIRIDTADPQRNPPKPDLRKMLVPLGPVVVFGAANFPFAYSTAGGDTACALAAGCTVIVKAHPGHPATSQKVAELIKEAVQECSLPEGVFIHLFGSGSEVGGALIQHPLAKAVGFTGSFEGGKALFDLANQRKEPIPVFAEMGSVNPVIILPGKLNESAEAIASLIAGSVTLSAGQFCTNPGILIALKGMELEDFKSHLTTHIEKLVPQHMLHPGIAKNFRDKRESALSQQGVGVVAASQVEPGIDEGMPTIAAVKAPVFLQNPILHKEVFGPYSILVECESIEQLKEVVSKLEGQLTCTLIATENEVEKHPDLPGLLQEKCGRIILNGVPTGVEVAMSMHHGGPYPATTDSRFTSVGADGIKRFARPLCFQNWMNRFLPDELKEGNPLGIIRTVNGKLTS